MTMISHWFFSFDTVVVAVCPQARTSVVQTMQTSVISVDVLSMWSVEQVI